MVLKREDTTSGDSSSLPISQQLTHASENDVARRTTPYLLTEPDEEGKKAYLMLHLVVVGCIMETESRDGREALRKPDMLTTG